MHTECGYTFDAEGRVGNLTAAEERQLWRGRNLWYEHVENSEAEDTDDGITGKAKQAGKMDASAERKWQQFKKQANG